jgi:hypothetical protein
VVTANAGGTLSSDNALHIVRKNTRGTSLANNVLRRFGRLLAISEIFGPGRPVRFHSAHSVADTKRLLHAALAATSIASNPVSLVGEVGDDRVRIQCVIREGGVAKRNYTCFSGLITELGEGSELIGSFVVPLHGKILVAVLLLSAFIFALADFTVAVDAQSSVALLCRGPAVLLAALIVLPYVFGLDQQQIEEISTRIEQTLSADSRPAEGTT